MRERFAMRLLAGCILCLFLPFSSAGAAEQKKERTEGTYEHYAILQEGFFRILFMREGEEAVPALDSNADGWPDFVEDVAAQLAMAHGVFCEAGGLPSPLLSPRYAGVRYIDVEIRGEKGMRGNKGLAYDEIVLRQDSQGAAADAAGAQRPKVRVLLIALSRDIDPKRNNSPAHEYFHQIQNGMTHFKNPWFYEGMARWSESALGAFRPKAKEQPLPLAAERLLSEAAYRERLFSASYAASDMLWAPLAALCPETRRALADDHPLLARRYSDGSPVLRNEDFSGIFMMKRVLEKLGEAENIPFTRFGYEKWTEANQRRAENNPFIAKAVEEAAAEPCPR